MNAKKARKLRLPPVAFSLSYPDGLEVIASKQGVRNDNYLQLVAKHRDGKLHEVLSIGYARSAGALHAEGNFGKMAWNTWKGALTQMAQQFRNQYPKGKFVVMEGKWHSLRTPQVQGTMHVKDPEQKLDHDVLFLVVVVPPPMGTPHGVMLMMQAVLGISEVKTFEDFERKGMPAQVWKTFRFAKAK